MQRLDGESWRVAGEHSDSKNPLACTNRKNAAAKFALSIVVFVKALVPERRGVRCAGNRTTESSSGQAVANLFWLEIAACAFRNVTCAWGGKRHSQFGIAGQADAEPSVLAADMAEFAVSASLPEKSRRNRNIANCLTPARLRCIEVGIS